MATLQTTSLTRYELTDEEAISGHILTTYNKYAIQNCIADLSEEKLALKFDVNNQLEFIQREAHLAGKIEVLKALLDISDSVSNRQI